MHRRNNLRIILIILFLLFPFYLSAETAYFPPKLVLFEAKDLGRRTFYVQVKMHENDSAKYFETEKREIDKKELEVDKTNLAIAIGDSHTLAVQGTVSWPLPGVMEWEVIALKDQAKGKTKIRLLDSNDKELDWMEGTIPELKTGVNEQPIIEKLEPAGGTLGDNVSILGRNLGKDINSIYIFFLAHEEDKINLFKEKEYSKTPPLYLTIRENKENKVTEEIRFTIPNYMIPETEFGFWERYLTGKTIKVYLLSANRRSNLVSLSILPKYWKFLSGGFTVVVLLFFLGIVALVFRKWNYVPNVLIDTRTGSYSLAKFQSFAWTIVLIGSYFYVAICAILLSRNGTLPDFKVSLIALMGISYAGLVTSNYLDNKVPTNRLLSRKPKWKDLFTTQDEEIDMAKLQLFGFTLIAIFAYIINLFLSNAMEGLPEIPPTLHMLLITSQSGYIGGKAVSDKLAVNFLEPSKGAIPKTLCNF